MNQTGTSARSEAETGDEPSGGVARSGRGYVSKGASYLRRGVESNAVAAIVGGAGLLGGVRAFRGGKRKRGLAGVALGAAFLAAAFARRRSRSPGGESAVEETDVVDTGPDVEAVAGEAGGVGERDHATGEAAAAVTDTSPDKGDASSGPESEPDDDAGSTAAEGTFAGADTGTEDVDRLGQAALDGQSREVPAPQRAFNQGHLAHSAEVFWGIRADDDAVLVSLDYDAIDGRDGVRYVGSSQIGEDVRELPIPDAVLDHWDEVIGGGTAVAAGDDVLFATTDELAADGLLRVLPAEWADDVFG